MLLDENGQPMSLDRQQVIREAYRFLSLLSTYERGLVMCWYCNECREHIPPGGKHECKHKKPLQVT